MSSTNLTREEARHRSEIIKVERYHVRVDVRGADADGATHFTSSTRLRFSSEQSDTFLDLLDAEIESVIVNDEEVDPEYDGSRIQLHGLRTHRKNLVVVTAKLPYQHTGQGLHRFVDPADGNVYLYTHFEAADSRRMYTVFEQPDLKAHVDFDVLAPQGWRVISNQVHEDTRDEDGGILHDFALTPRMSTYLTAIAAGPYVRFEDEWHSRDGSESIPLGILARASLAEYVDHEEIFKITKQGLAFYHDAFGYPYPWGKYDQIFVPEYNLGAMENPGLVTFTENYIHRGPATRSELAGRTNTILHEMAHMWFGDLVTPKWWDDLWLKESFAEYMGAHASVNATEYREAWTNFAVGRKAWAYTADQQSTTHPIVADIVDLEAARQNFDGITYAKGASVLKQLVAHVGVEKFFSAARHYFRELAFSSATLDDLIRHLEKACGRDLSSWVNAWLKTTGPDVLLPELTVRDGVVQELAVVRDSIDVRTGRDVSRPHTLRVGLYSLQGNDLVRTDLIDVTLSSPRTPVREAVGKPAPDLILINDDDLTYAKVRLGATGTKTVLAHLSGLPNPLARALVWSMLWNAVRDAKLKVQDYLDAVALHGPKETEPAILTTVLQQLRMAVENYLPDSARDNARRAEAARAWRGLDESEPGSDLQRIWARHALALSTADPESVDRVRELLDGHVTDLAVDPELRWQAWTALAALGQASAEDLDAELERDRTKTGVAHHMAARTACPDDVAKQDAYRRLRTPGELSNEHCLALIDGLRTPLGAETFASLNGSYFDDLEQIWQEFPIEMAQRLVIGLFPDGDVAEDADHWLAHHPSATGGLTRTVKELRDAASRAETARDYNS
ncbi:aminopeptidase N [Cutibacterium avidum]|uniref:aminopeptidase N n=1 Tax=Cutibacterium avidum TaxID=33010 RepID=UPI00336C18FA